MENFLVRTAYHADSKKREKNKTENSFSLKSLRNSEDCKNNNNCHNQLKNRVVLIDRIFQKQLKFIDQTSKHEHSNMIKLGSNCISRWSNYSYTG